MRQVLHALGREATMIPTAKTLRRGPKRIEGGQVGFCTGHDRYCDPFDQLERRERDHGLQALVLIPGVLLFLGNFQSKYHEKIKCKDLETCQGQTSNILVALKSCRVL